MKIRISWYQRISVRLVSLAKHRLALVAGLLTIILALGATGAYNAGAEQSGWLDGIIQTLMTPVDESNPQFCQVETVKILDSPDNQRLFSSCVFRSEGVEVLASTSYNTMYVRLPSSGDFFRPVQTSINALSYISSLDRLVYKTNGGDPHLHVVDHLSQSLQNYGWTTYGGPSSYTLRTIWDRELLLGSYADQLNQYQVTNNFAVSANGRVAFVYTNGQRVQKVDLDTGQSQVIEMYQSFWYDGMDIPDMLASSSDGRYLLIGPMARLVDTGSGCGTPLLESGGVIDACPVRELGHGADIGLAHNYLAQLAEFDDDDQSISIRYWLDTRWGTIYIDGSPSNVFVNFSLVGAPVVSAHPTYLALGDSYSSGEGDIYVDDIGGSYYTDNSVDGCHLSKRSYPFVLGELWEFDPLQLHSVACSGALIRDDYTTDANFYDGQRGEFMHFGQSRELYIDQALQNYQPGWVPQIEFVKKYQPSVITLTGGGNDVGFADVLAYCAGDAEEEIVFGDSCDYVEGGKLHQFLDDTIDSQFVLVRDLIRRLRDADPDARIYYVGYPSFISDSSVCALNSGLLSRLERQMINQAISRLNNVIRLATEAEGVVYVDIENTLAGGRLCEGSQYMTGTWDVGLTKVLSGDIPSGLFHPNADGHSLIAQAIYNQVPNPMAAMPGKTINAITVDPTTPTYRARIVKDDTVKEGEMLEIDLAMGGEYADDQVFAVAFSNQVDLGSYHLASDGSLKQSIPLPKDLDPGQHLLVVEIKMVDGSTEKLFQYFYIEPADPSASSTSGEGEGDNSPEEDKQTDGDTSDVENQTVTLAEPGRDYKLTIDDGSNAPARSWSTPDQLVNRSVDKLTYAGAVSDNSGAGSDASAEDGEVLGDMTDNYQRASGDLTAWLLWGSVSLTVLITGCIIMSIIRRRARNY